MGSFNINYERKRTFEFPKLFCKISVLIDFVKFTGKYLYWSIFCNKITNLICNFITKKTPAQVYFSQFKNRFVEEHLRTADSRFSKRFIHGHILCQCPKILLKPIFYKRLSKTAREETLFL